jgi:hypothetical protein
MVTTAAQTYAVTQPFNASIRRRLALCDAESASHFPPSTTVHVVASPIQAGATVLADADVQSARLRTQQRPFFDYPVKMAIKQQRVLRHELVDQTVHAHDLHLAAMFS